MVLAAHSKRANGPKTRSIGCGGAPYASTPPNPLEFNQQFLIAPGEPSRATTDTNHTKKKTCTTVSRPHKKTKTPLPFVAQLLSA